MWGVMPNYRSQIAVVSSVQVVQVADSAAELDGFKRIRVIEGDEFGDEIRALGHQPQMASKVPSVEGAASVHETSKGWVKSRIATEIEGDMRETVINSDGHRRKRWARRRGQS
jgi:hypothetical protein